MTTTPKSQVLKIAGLVSYQEGSVVSRQIMKSDGGNVTLFAFDRGQELSEHTTPYDALVQILEGKAELTISGKPFHLAVGESILMPANEPHALMADKKFKMLLTMIRA
jgi:quercetin dioxygenase-like cupin family protein